MRTIRIAGALGVIVAGVILIFAFHALAAGKALRWNAPTTYTDNTTIDAATLAKLKYYVRTLEPNGRSANPDITGQYYLGEVAPGGATQWPAGGEIDNVLQGYGLEGKTITFTVSCGYTDTGGVFRESVPSGGYAYAVPFVPGKIPGAVNGLTVN